MREHHLPLWSIISLSFLFFIVMSNCQFKKTTSSSICDLPSKYFDSRVEPDCFNFHLSPELKHYETMLFNLENKLISADSLGEKLLIGIQTFKQMDTVKYAPIISMLQRSYSVYLNTQSRMEASTDVLQEAIQHMENHQVTRCDSSLLASLYSYIGLDYHLISNYKASIKYLQKSLALNKQLNDANAIALDYSNLVLPYLGKGSYDKAIEVGRIANCIWASNGYPTENKEMYLSAKLNLATAEYEQGKIHYYRKEIGRSTNLLNSSLAIYREIATALKTDSIISPKARQSLSIYTFFNTGINLTIKRDLENLKIDTTYFQQIFEEIKKMEENPHKKHYLNLGHTLMGVLYAYTGNCTKAEQSIQNAINDALLSVSDTVDLSNAYVYHKVQFLQTLYARGQIKEICYEQSKNLNDLKETLANYIDMIDYVENIRNGFAIEAYKEDLNNTIHAYYNKATSIAVRLYQLTKDVDYLNQAFGISDKGKSILLHEALVAKSTLQNLSNTHPFYPLLQKEKKFNKQIHQLNIQLIVATQNEQTLVINELKDRLDKTINTYQDFIANLQKGSSIEQKYYWSKKVKNPPSIDDIQRNYLDSNTAIIAYEFLGRSQSCFSFLITKEQQSVIPIAADSTIYQLVEQFEESVKDPLLFYSKEAYALNEKILAPVLKKLPDNIKKLVFIPSDILNKIHFQALLVKPTKSSTPFHQMPYLIKEFDLSYLPSISVYEMLSRLHQQPNNLKNKFAGFVANPSKKSLSHLKTIGLSQKYLDIIQYFEPIPNISDATQKITTKYFPNEKLDTAATKFAFFNQAKNNNIVQLSLHGFFDARNDSVPNFLFFQPSDFDNGILTLEELHGTALNTDLIVLSSCHSSEGTLNPIEGIISFSRAFFFAGCKATITTTDDIEEKKAAEIITRFYHYLIDKQVAPSRAICNSQRDYLEAASFLPNDAAHPVNWAHYRHSGLDDLKDVDLSRSVFSLAE